MGEIKRTVLILRRSFLSKKVSKNHYRKERHPSQHPNLEFFKSAFRNLQSELILPACYQNLEAHLRKFFRYR